jgi:hypothetical protein
MRVRIIISRKKAIFTNPLCQDSIDDDSQLTMRPRSTDKKLHRELNSLTFLLSKKLSGAGREVGGQRPLERIVSA